MQIANFFSICKATVSNIIKDYILQRFNACIIYKYMKLKVILNTPIGKDAIRIILKNGT